MNQLHERTLNPYLPAHRTILDAGGLWIVPADAEPSAVVAEVRERRLRALEVNAADLAFLRDLPALEFLQLRDVADVKPLHRLHRLRGLHVSGTWDGTIDFQAFPRLESFGVVECPRDGGGLDTLLAGHSTLRSLAVGRYRHPDLTPLAGLSLERLSLGDSRTLQSLDGAGALAATLKKLDLYLCPYLESLAGIELLRGLQAVALASLRHVTTVEFAAALPGLRHLDAFELRNVKSLWPLAAHPSLEFAAFGRVRDLDLDPLTTIPKLRLILTGTYRWNRDIHSFPYMHDVADDHPARVAWRELQAV